MNEVMGFVLTEGEVNTLFAHYDKDDSETLDLKEFCKLVDESSVKKIKKNRGSAASSKKTKEEEPELERESLQEETETLTDLLLACSEAVEPEGGLRSQFIESDVDDLGYLKQKKFNAQFKKIGFPLSEQQISIVCNNFHDPAKFPSAAEDAEPDSVDYDALCNVRPGRWPRLHPPNPLTFCSLAGARVQGGGGRAGRDPGQAERAAEPGREEQHELDGHEEGHEQAGGAQN